MSSKEIVSRAHQIRDEQIALVGGLDDNEVYDQLRHKVLDVFTHKAAPSMMSIPVNYERDDDCYVSLRMQELYDRLTLARVEIEQLRNKLMEGENLAQEFSYFGMRNEIGKKHPALQKRIDDFIKSSFPLLLTKGSLASSLRASGYSEKDDDTEILNLADADYGPESDKDTEPVCPVHKQKLAPGRSCEYCAMDDALDEHLSEKDNG